MTILNALFSTTANGTFSDLLLDTIADAYTVTIDEADAFIESLVALTLIGEDENGDLYDVQEREAYEDSQDLVDSEQAFFDAWQGYMVACC